MQGVYAYIYFKLILTKKILIVISITFLDKKKTNNNKQIRI